MSLDDATVARVARLARIEVSADRLPQLADELSNILGWIEQLNEVDTDQVEPLRSVMPLKGRFREDRVTDGNRADEVLANAPERDDGHFLVPKVVE